MEELQIHHTGRRSPIEAAQIFLIKSSRSGSWTSQAGFREGKKGGILQAALIAFAVEGDLNDGFGQRVARGVAIAVFHDRRAASLGRRPSCIEGLYKNTDVIRGKDPILTELGKVLQHCRRGPHNMTGSWL